MLGSGKYMNEMMQYQAEATRKYGYMSNYERILLKRSINSSFYIIDRIDKFSFEQLELGLYMKVTDKEMLRFVKLFEYQIEEAKLHPDNFINNLHFFCMSTGKLIVEKHTKNFFDFMDFIIRKAREKVDYKGIFDAYVSLLLQQCIYIGYLKGYEEKLCSGLTTENEIIFKDDLFPYSDCASYELEKETCIAIKTNKMVDFKLAQAAYKKFGYEINSFDDINYLDATSRLYDNNHFMMMCYINEHTEQMLPVNAYKHCPTQYPRQWADTQTYKELLSKRKYVLPTDGVTALYYNAGLFNKILYQEIYKNEKIILLYKVISDSNGEFSGYYDTKTQDFFSLFEDSNIYENHIMLENFILENYYTLTCDSSIDRKKLTVLKQVEDINKIDNFYGKQPVVCYQYKKRSQKANDKTSSLKHYNRDDYKTEMKSINGFIRKLPVGQHASDEAKQFAVQLGYELVYDETFVRPFEKHVLKIKEI